MKIVSAVVKFWLSQTKLLVVPLDLSNPMLNKPAPALRVTSRVTTVFGVVFCAPCELLKPAQKTPDVLRPVKSVSFVAKE